MTLVTLCLKHWYVNVHNLYYYAHLLIKVFIIGLLAVEKYENFRPVLDTYCDHHFNAASVHLLASLPRYLLNFN